MSGMSGMLGIPGITLTFGIQPKSSATSVAFLVSLPRRYSICTVSPGSSLRASCTRLVPGPDSSSSSALSPASAVPLNLVMMSPTLSPAFAAGPPGVTPSIFAPSLSTWESGWVFTTTPIRPRLSSCKTKTPGGRGGRRGRCAARLAGQAASMAAAITIQVRCIIRCSFGASQPHVSGASDVDAHELLHELHALLPQCDEVGGTRLGLRGAQLCQLAVDDGNAVFQGGGERRGAAARHPPVGVVPLELLLQRRRLLFHSRQLGGVDGLGPERPEHEEPRERRGRGEARDAPPLAAPAPLGQHGVPHRGPAVPRRSARRQRLQLRDALVQCLELGPARRASHRVLPRPRGPFPGRERQQVVHRAVHHRATPSSSSMPRRRACARASCDLEKLTVLPICSAISSCVYPSTSCSHTTAREVSLNRSNARSRSMRAGIPAPPGPAAASSCNSSVARTWLRLIRIRALEDAICRIQPHRCPSPRNCLMLRTTSRNVSCSTSSASSGRRSTRSARLYTGVSNAR